MLVSFSLMLCGCLAHAAESPAELKDFNPEVLLNRMGISAVFNEDAYITRGDFAILAVQASGNYILTNETFFSDVNGEQGRYVNTAASLGFVYADETGLFEPDRIILSEEAAAICLRVLGYEHIMQDISYPTDYMLQASRLGLVKNMPSGRQLTGADASMMIFNMLRSKYVGLNMPVSVSGTGYAISQNTFMEEIFGVKEENGTVTSICGLALSGESAADGDHIIIGGVIYENPYYSSADSYINIGQKVIFYTRDTDDGAEVVYMYKSGSVLTVDAYDIVSAQGFDSGDSAASKRSPRLEYSQNGSSSQKTVALDPRASVFINGVSSVSVKNADFKPENGTVYLTDSNSDGVYDVISIEKYVYYKVHSFEEYDGVMTDEYGKQPLRLNDFSEDLISIVTGDRLADKSVITRDSVFEIMCSFKDDGSFDSNKYIRLRLLSGVVKGRIESISKDYFYIDGKPYRVTNELRPEFESRLGLTGTFCLANEELIVAYNDFQVRDALDYGYLVGVGAEGVFDNSYKFRIYTMQGEMIDLEPSEKLRFAGERNGIYSTGYAVQDKDITAMLAAGQLEPQMVKYELDDSGRLALLQMAVDHTDEPDYIGYDNQYFSLDFKSTTADALYRYDRYMENGYYFDNRTIVIYATSGSVSAEDFDIGKYAMRGGSFRNLQLEIYDTSDTLTVKYAVVKDVSAKRNNGGGGSLYFNTSGTWLVKENSKVLDENGDIVTELSLQRGDMPSTLRAVSDDLAPLNTSYGGDRKAVADGALTSTGEYGVPTTITKISELEAGDIISVMTNSRGKIAGYVVLHEYDRTHTARADEIYQEKENMPWLGDFRRVVGDVTEFNIDSSMKVDASANARLCIGRTTPVYMIYNAERNTVEVPGDRINLNVGDYVWVYVNRIDVQIVVKYVND